MTTKSRSGIEPTLFIGLGGVGGKILGNLRSLFDRTFRSDGDGGSPVQFLLLDTDDFQKLDESVSKSLNEQEEFLSISHFNPRHYIDEHRRDHRSDLHRWFDWDARPLLEDAFVRDGASRLRILGRLCFHRAYYEVEKVLSDKIARAKSATAYVQGGERIRTTERPFRVVIVGSTCGGTGSGIFLDLVYLLNRLVRSSGSTPDVLSFLFLPYWFIEANRKIDTDLVPYYQANAWAFFEELNYVLLHPSRLAEIALDPGRPNGVPAPPVRADYEPLKTIYLMDAEIPNVGRFHDSADWNAYVAESIFQVFLAPEEGNLESVFSNIKTKLAETDRRYGLKKRFAALGYADLRHPGTELHDFLARRSAVQYVHDQLLHAAAPAAVEDAARELLEGIEGAVQSAGAIREGIEPQLNLDEYAMSRGQTRVASAAKLGKIGAHVAAAVDAFNAALPRQAAVDDAVAAARALVEARLGRLKLGLQGEKEVLERVFERLAPAAAELPPAPHPFAVGSQPLAGTAAITEELSRAKGLFRGGPSDQPSTYLPHLNALNADLKERTAQYRNERAAAIRAELLLRIAGTPQSGEWRDPLGGVQGDGAIARSVLGDAHHRLRRAHAALQHASHDAADRGLGATRKETLTTRYHPPVTDPAETWAQFRVQYEHTKRGRQFDLEGIVRELAQEILARDGAGAPGHALDRAVARLATFFQGAFQHSADVVKAHREACERLDAGVEAGDPEAREERARLENLLQNLYPLSTPCCRIDESRLSRGDTTPRVFVAASNLKEAEVQNLLRLPAVPGVIDNDGAQFSLLQAVYAFPTLAVAGMEALRQAYETRDRARSFPHIQREWNQRDLRVSRQGELTDQELLQFGRARAMSELMRRLTGAPTEPSLNGHGRRRVFLPGLRLAELDGDGGDPVWITRYVVDPRDGRPHLQARSVRPVEGHERIWTVAEAAEDLMPLNLDQNVRRYIASPVRETHDRLFATDIHEMERSEHQGEYAAAYREYAEHLEGVAERHADAGRSDEERLHRRLAQVVKRYAEELRGSDDPTP